jgi:hypothetical protein
MELTKTKGFDHRLKLQANPFNSSQMKISGLGEKPSIYEWPFFSSILASRQYVVEKSVDI